MSEDKHVGHLLNYGLCICYRGVQQSVQMEEDIDLQIIQEREKAIRQLEVCSIMILL